MPDLDHCDDAFFVVDMPLAEARGYLTDEDISATYREGLSGHVKLEF